MPVAWSWQPSATDAGAPAPLPLPPPAPLAPLKPTSPGLFVVLFVEALVVMLAILVSTIPRAQKVCNCVLQHCRGNSAVDDHDYHDLESTATSKGAPYSKHRQRGGVAGAYGLSGGAGPIAAWLDEFRYACGLWYVSICLPKHQQRATPYARRHTRHAIRRWHTFASDCRERKQHMYSLLQRRARLSGGAAPSGTSPAAYLALSKGVTYLALSPGRSKRQAGSPPSVAGQSSEAEGEFIEPLVGVVTPMTPTRRGKLVGAIEPEQTMSASPAVPSAGVGSNGGAARTTAAARSAEVHRDGTRPARQAACPHGGSTQQRVHAAVQIAPSSSTNYIWSSLRLWTGVRRWKAFAVREGRRKQVLRAVLRRLSPESLLLHRAMSALRARAPAWQQLARLPPRPTAGVRQQLDFGSCNRGVGRGAAAVIEAAAGGDGPKLGPDELVHLSDDAFWARSTAPCERQALCGTPLISTGIFRFAFRIVGRGGGRGVVVGVCDATDPAKPATEASAWGLHLGHGALYTTRGGGGTGSEQRGAGGEQSGGGGETRRERIRGNLSIKQLVPASMLLVTTNEDGDSDGGYGGDEDDDGGGIEAPGAARHATSGPSIIPSPCTPQAVPGPRTSRTPHTPPTAHNPSSTTTCTLGSPPPSAPSRLTPGSGASPTAAAAIGASGIVPPLIYTLEVEVEVDMRRRRIAFGPLGGPLVEAPGARLPSRVRPWAYLWTSDDAVMLDARPATRRLRMVTDYSYEVRATASAQPTLVPLRSLPRAAGSGTPTGTPPRAAANGTLASGPSVASSCFSSLGSAPASQARSVASPPSSHAEGPRGSSDSAYATPYSSARYRMRSANHSSGGRRQGTRSSLTSRRDQRYTSQRARRLTHAESGEYLPHHFYPVMDDAFLVPASPLPPPSAMHSPAGRPHTHPPSMQHDHDDLPCSLSTPHRPASPIDHERLVGGRPRQHAGQLEDNRASRALQQSGAPLDSRTTRTKGLGHHSGGVGDGDGGRIADAAAAATAPGPQSHLRHRRPEPLEQQACMPVAQHQCSPTVDAAVMQQGHSPPPMPLQRGHEALGGSAATGDATAATCCKAAQMNEGVDPADPIRVTEVATPPVARHRQQQGLAQHGVGGASALPSPWTGRASTIDPCFDHRLAPDSAHTCREQTAPTTYLALSPGRDGEPLTGVVTPWTPTRRADADVPTPAPTSRAMTISAMARAKAIAESRPSGAPSSRVAPVATSHAWDVMRFVTGLYSDTSKQI